MEKKVIDLTKKIISKTTIKIAAKAGRRSKIADFEMT